LTSMTLANVSGTKAYCEHLPFPELCGILGRS